MKFEDRYWPPDEPFTGVDSFEQQRQAQETLNTSRDQIRELWSAAIKGSVGVNVRNKDASNTPDLIYLDWDKVTEDYAGSFACFLNVYTNNVLTGDLSIESIDKRSLSVFAFLCNETYKRTDAENQQLGDEYLVCTQYEPENLAGLWEERLYWIYQQPHDSLSAGKVNDYLVDKAVQITIDQLDQEKAVLECNMGYYRKNL